MAIKGKNNRYDVYDNGDSVTMIRNDNTEDSPYNPNMIEFQKPTQSTVKPGTWDGVEEYRHNLLSNNLTDTNLDTYTPSGAPKAPTGAPGESSRPNSALGSVSGGFSFSGTKPTYTSPYQDQIDALLSQIQNRPDFDYNYLEDPTYEIYRDQYTREGNLAMRDTVGASAALSGGYGNSYGTTAGSQAYQAYLGKLNAIVPELEALAYDRYQSEGNDLYNQLSALSSLENAAYNQYRDQMGDYYNDYQLAYQQYADQLAQDNYEDELAYQRGQDSLAYSEWLQEFNQAQQEAARDLAYRYAAAGLVYPYDDAATSVQYLAGTGGSSGGSGSGSSSKSSSKKSSSSSSEKDSTSSSSSKWSYLHDTLLNNYGADQRSGAATDSEIGSKLANLVALGQLEDDEAIDIADQLDIMTAFSNAVSNLNKNGRMPTSSSNSYKNNMTK